MIDSPIHFSWPHFDGDVCACVQVGGQDAKIVGGVDSTTFAGADKFKWITHLYMEDELYSYAAPHRSNRVVPENCFRVVFMM